MPAMTIASSRAAIETPDSRGEHFYTISDLGAEFGVTARLYEDEGLIAPGRDGLARIYSRRDRGRLAWILRGKRVGFSLAEIREMIDLYDIDPDHAEQRRVTEVKCRERIALLEQQKSDIDAAITEISAFLDQLRDPSAR
jgi:DNA-binding transcriptional MerR regulator